MGTEQRRSTRKRTFLKGKILFNAGASSIDCLVRDLSDEGARIELSETSTLPEVFDLHIPQRDATYRSTLRWRHDGLIGVTFGEPAAASPPPPPPAAAIDVSLQVVLRRLAELEAENTVLRSLLAKVGQAA